MKHAELISQMSLTEKAVFLSGKTVWETWDFPSLGIGSIFMSDGPHGLRKQAGEGDHLGLNASLPATCFPTAVTLAGSWDSELVTRVGEALGAEARALDVHIILGPGLNIKRSPLCGRNFEYFSEDPYVSGKLAAAMIRGIHSKGVLACPKHFAVNSQETRRMAMDAIVDERTLREIYLTGFEIAVKEGNAHAIMSSYNEVNGCYANESKKLLTDILRREWGFDGIVITDWGGSNDHVEGVRAGSNLEMPCPGLDPARELIEAVNNGTLDESVLDERVDELLNAVLQLTEAKKNMPVDLPDMDAHHKLACEAAVKSAVLLKNDDHILPLKPGARVALIGDFAQTPRYQGAGSSMVNATQVGAMISEQEGTDMTIVGFAAGYRRDGGEDEALAAEAVQLAKQADVVIYCFGLDELSESEGLDRQHMRIPAQQISLLEKLASVNENIVGVMSAGAAVEMPWENHCRAILHMMLSGQAGADAAWRLLTGADTPSGKLTETYPLRYEDTPSYHYYPSKERTSEYREGIFVGYRYYGTAKKEVRYPFGYGLSYTTFSYGDLTADAAGVELCVTNTGAYTGEEVVQLYVGKKESRTFRPVRELKGFAKVKLCPGETKKIRIPFDEQTFRIWNVQEDRWDVEAGVYDLEIGASSADIRLRGHVHVHPDIVGGKKESGISAAVSAAHRGTPDRGRDERETNMLLGPYRTGDVANVDDRTYEALLGHPIPDGKWGDVLGKNDAICQMYQAKSRLARLAYKILTIRLKKSEEKGKPDLNILFIYNMPFRALAKMTNGAVNGRMVDGIVSIVNGHFFGGVKTVISAAVHGRRFEKNMKRHMKEQEEIRLKKTDV